MKITTNIQTSAPACFDMARVRTSEWATPVQGIAMSAPAYGLGSVAGMTTTVTANAAKGAHTKRTAGYEAFEDPV